MGINMDRVVSLATVSVSARWEGAKTSCLGGCRQWGTTMSAHFPRQMHRGIKSAHGDALPTFAVCCSVSSKSWITVAFKRSFFILTGCFYMTVMRTTYALVYIYNTMVYWISMKFCNTEFLHAPPITLSLSLSHFPLPLFFVSSFLAHFIV